MPISAHRWHRLIQAARNAQMARQQCLESTMHKTALIRQGKLTKEQAWDDYCLEIQALTHGTNSDIVIAEELWTFNHNYRRNKQEQARQERKRREKGMSLKKQPGPPETDLTAGPSILLSDKRWADAAQKALEVDATDNLPDEFDFVTTDDVPTLEPESPEDIATYQRMKAQEAERMQIEAEIEAKRDTIDAEVNATSITRTKI